VTKPATPAPIVPAFLITFSTIFFPLKKYHVRDPAIKKLPQKKIREKIVKLSLK